MLIRAPRIEMGEGETVLVCPLESEHGAIEPFELRLGVASEFAAWVDRSATPALPVASVLATAIGEDLRSEAPASPMLARGAEEVSRMLAGWWGYRAVRVSAPTTPSPERSGPGEGALFSRGVDSSATVIRSLRGEIPERVTHLLSVYGAEWMFSPATHEAIWHDTERAAGAYGLELVRLTTNARDVLRGRIGWVRSYGAVFAGVALLLGPLLRSVLFGATQHPDHAEPRGSRFDVDPLWSTERTVFRQDAAEVGRLERAAIVASDPVAASMLKVCFEQDSPGNCGRCEKCLRTMTMLAATGELDRVPAFDAPLTPDAVRSCRITTRQLGTLRELVVELPDEPRELDGLRAAWKARLAEVEAKQRAERRREALRPLRRAWRRSRRRLRRARRARSK